MNAIQTLNTEYIRPSRTIETILVSKGKLNKVFYLYNYEGNSFRLFESHLGLIRFFQDNSESDFHFNTEDELDFYLSSVKIS